MKIGLTGASGFIGARIIQLANERGHEVIGYSRSAGKKIAGCVETRVFRLDETVNVEGCEGIIHLAGESVMGLWTPGKKRKILGSRKVGTRHVVEAIRASSRPPRVLVSASAIGFYGDPGEYEVDEDSPPGSGFLARVSRAWETEALRAEESGVCVCRLRISLVLGKNGGALKLMTPIFRAGLGGVLGSGRQWISWIHLDDVAGLALFALENAELRGALNACSPQPCRNRDFTRALAAALQRPAFFRVPAFALKIALGGFSHELLDSKRVIPRRARACEYRYRFPELSGALLDITQSNSQNQPA